MVFQPKKRKSFAGQLWRLSPRNGSVSAGQLSLVEVFCNAKRRDEMRSTPQVESDVKDSETHSEVDGRDE